VGGAAAPGLFDVVHQICALRPVDPAVIALHHPVVLLIGTRGEFVHALGQDGALAGVGSKNRADEVKEADEGGRADDPPDELDDQPDDEQHTNQAGEPTAAASRPVSASAHRSIRSDNDRRCLTLAPSVRPRFSVSVRQRSDKYSFRRSSVQRRQRQLALRVGRSCKSFWHAARLVRRVDGVPGNELRRHKPRTPRRHLAAEESHRMLDERLEGVARLPRVAHVVVEDQRHQREGRRAAPG
jgi:hypothetical protein